MIVELKDVNKEEIGNLFAEIANETHQAEHPMTHNDLICAINERICDLGLEIWWDEYQETWQWINR